MSSSANHGGQHRAPSIFKFSGSTPKFHFGLFDKRDSSPFSIARMPEKSSNVPSSVVYSAIGAESLRIARVSNNPASFSTAIKPLIARMSWQGVSIGKINSSVLKFFHKHHSDFNVCQSNQELLNLISYVINRYFLFIQANQ